MTETEEQPQVQQTVTMFSPEGKLADVPVENSDKAVQAGFKKAVTMTSPEGRRAYLPPDKAQQALTSGFAVGHPDQQPRVKMYDQDKNYKEIPANAQDYALSNGWRKGMEFTSPSGAGLTLHPDQAQDALNLGWKTGTPSQQPQTGFVTKTVGGMSGINSSDIANKHFSDSVRGKQLIQPPTQQEVYPGGLYQQPSMGMDTSTDEGVRTAGGINEKAFQKLSKLEQSIVMNEARVRAGMPWESKISEALPVAGSMIASGSTAGKKAYSAGFKYGSGDTRGAAMDLSEAAGHGGAALTPFFGAPAEQSGEEFGQGHIKEGLQSAGLALAPFAAEPMAKGAGAAVDALKPTPRSPLSQIIRPKNAAAFHEAEQTAAPLVRTAAAERGQPVKTVDDALDNIRQAKQNALIDAQNSLEPGQTVDDLPDFAKKELQEKTDSLTTLEQHLTDAKKVAEETKDQPTRTQAAGRVVAGATKMGAGIVASRFVPHGRLGLEMAGVGWGMRDIAGGIKDLVARRALTEENLNKVVSESFSGEGPVRSASPDEIVPSNSQPVDTSAPVHETTPGPPDQPGGDITVKTDQTINRKPVWQGVTDTTKTDVVEPPQAQGPLQQREPTPPPVKPTPKPLPVRDPVTGRMKSAVQPPENASTPKAAEPVAPPSNASQPVDSQVPQTESYPRFGSRADLLDDKMHQEAMRADLERHDRSSMKDFMEANTFPSTTKSERIAGYRNGEDASLFAIARAPETELRKFAEARNLDVTDSDNSLSLARKLHDSMTAEEVDKFNDALTNLGKKRENGYRNQALKDIAPGRRMSDLSDAEVKKVEDRAKQLKSQRGSATTDEESDVLSKMFHGTSEANVQDILKRGLNKTKDASIDPSDQAVWAADNRGDALEYALEKTMDTKDRLALVHFNGSGLDWDESGAGHALYDGKVHPSRIEKVEIYNQKDVRGKYDSELGKPAKTIYPDKKGQRGSATGDEETDMMAMIARETARAKNGGKNLFVDSDEFMGDLTDSASSFLKYRGEKGVDGWKPDDIFQKAVKKGWNPQQVLKSNYDLIKSVPDAIKKGQRGSATGDELDDQLKKTMAGSANDTDYMKQAVKEVGGDRNFAQLNPNERTQAIARAQELKSGNSKINWVHDPDSELPSYWPVKKVPIDKIKTADTPFEDTVDEYAQNMKKGGDWPALTVDDKQNGTYGLVEGNHRLAAAKKNGENEVGIQVRPPNKKDWYKSQRGSSTEDEISKIPFFSRGAQVANQKLPPVFSAEQARNTLKNAGISGDELKVANDWLADQRGKVKKADLVEVMNNGLKVNVVKKEVPQFDAKGFIETHPDIKELRKLGYEPVYNEPVEEPIFHYEDQEGEAYDASNIESSKARRLAKKIEKDFVAARDAHGQTKGGEPLDDRQWDRAMERAEEEDGQDIAEGLAEIHYGKSFEDLTETQKEQLGDSDDYNQGIEEAAHEYYEGEYGQAGPTKYSEYQVPGGTNYREHLIQVDRPKNSFEPEESQLKELEIKNGVPPPQLHGKYVEWYENLRKNNPEAFKEITDLQSKIQEKVDKVPNPFQSGHFDEPNVVAHARMNDRIDVNGKKTLFLEELQSDWHQQGREKGYLEPDKKYLPGEIERGNSNGVPDAPFKKDWPLLLIKHALREAVEKGQDQVAWTPGSVQAERYDLSRHVDSIQVKRNNTGTFDIIGKKEGNTTPIVKKTDVKKEDLSDTIGKSLTQKVLEDSQSHTDRGIPTKWSNTYIGKDLQVGGQGMRGFYDDMLPAIANKYLKKWGAKVETTEIPGTESGLNLEVFDTGDPDDRDARFQVVNNGTVVNSFFTKKEANDYISSDKNSKKTIKVPVIKINPSMRHDILRGQPISELSTARNTNA